jgi:hypothetical protein
VLEIVVSGTYKNSKFCHIVSLTEVWPILVGIVKTLFYCLNRVITPLPLPWSAIPVANLRGEDGGDGREDKGTRGREDGKQGSSEAGKRARSEAEPGAEVIEHCRLSRVFDSHCHPALLMVRRGRLNAKRSESHGGADLGVVNQTYLG